MRTYECRARRWCHGACPTRLTATMAGVACLAACTGKATSQPRSLTHSPWARLVRCSTRTRTALSPCESALVLRWGSIEHNHSALPVRVQFSVQDMHCVRHTFEEAGRPGVQCERC